MSKLVGPRVTFVLGAILGALIVYNFSRQIEEKIEYRDRIKTETRIVTRIVERKNPDGSSSTTTEIVDTGSRTQDTSLTALKLAQKQYIVGAGASFEYGRFQVPEYNVTVGRRLMGPILGAVTISKERLQGSVLIEF